MQSLTHLLIDERNHRHPRLFIRLLTRPDLDKRSLFVWAAESFPSFQQVGISLTNFQPQWSISHSRKEKNQVGV